MGYQTKKISTYKQNKTAMEREHQEGGQVRYTLTFSRENLDMTRPEYRPIDLSNYWSAVDEKVADSFPLQPMVIQPRQRIESTVDDLNVNKSTGKIKCLLGPMRSGKTTTLHAMIEKHKNAKQSVLIVNFDEHVTNVDVNKYSCVPSSCILTREETVECGKELTILENIVAKYDVIGIDDGQFFEDVADFSEKLANAGKTVIVSALDGDENKNMYPSVVELLPKCDTYEKLTTVCTYCGKKASFTFKEGGYPFPFDTKKEGYQACCRRCYRAKSNKI